MGSGPLNSYDSSLNKYMWPCRFCDIALTPTVSLNFFHDRVDTLSLYKLRVGN